MKNRNTTLLGIGMVGLLSACTAEQCGDPNTDGLATALGCVAGPGYQQQTNALAAELSQRESIADDLRAENQRLNTNLASLGVEERQATSRLINVNGQIANLVDQLDAQLSQQQISRTEYELLQSQLSDLNSRRSSVDPGNAADTARIAELESDIAELESLF